MALKFQTIYAQLQAKIVSGEWPEGYRIPTEMELCQLFSVSRVTIRRALNGLVKRGYLERARGRGSYVKFQRTVLGASSAEMEKNNGHYRLLLKERKVATPVDAVRFGIPQTGEIAEIWHLRTLYYSNGKPTSIGDHYIAPQYGDLILGLSEEFTPSICAFLATALGQTPHVVDGRIAAILPCEASLSLLEMEERRAILWWRAYCAIEDGTIIGRCSKIYNSIEYEFAFNGAEVEALI